MLLLPYLTTGYYNDDNLNSMVRGYVGLHGLTLFGFIRSEITMWITHSGRFFPLANYCYYLWYYLPNLATYRWGQVLLTALDLFLFVTLLRRLGLEKGRAWLVGAIIPVLFQIRNFHDPITSYMGMLQLSFLLGTCSALLLVRYLRRGGTTALAASIFIFLVQVLIYEPGFVFLPVLFLVAHTEGNRNPAARTPERNPVQRRRALLSLVAITAIYAVGVGFLRYHFGTSYGGTRTGLQFRSIWAFICQTSAALPLVYSFLGKGGLYRVQDLWGAEFISWWTPAIGIASALLFHRMLHVPDQDGTPPKLFSRLGWILLLMPSLMIALSARYALEVNRPGTGYLPVFFAYFGMALLASEFALRWIGKGTGSEARRWKAATALAVFAVFAFNGNRIAAREMNQERMEHRLVVQAALEAGLFSGLPENAVLLHDETAGWLIPDFVYQYAHRKVTLVYREPKLPLPADSVGDYYLRVEESPDGTGSVVLGRIDPTREFREIRALRE
jgi:hypothetical protein